MRPAVLTRHLAVSFMLVVITVSDALQLVMSVIVVSVHSSCGRQMLKGISSGDTGESHQPFTSEAQRRRSGTYSYI